MWRSEDGEMCHGTSEKDAVLDLNLMRNIQWFMRLAGLEAKPPVALMCWCQGETETTLHYRGERVHLSQYQPVSSFYSAALCRGLRCWHPAGFYGVPQRLFRLRSGLVVSAALPSGSTSELWFQVHRQQQLLLETVCSQR